MRSIWTWIVPLVVVAGVVLGISYFQGDVFHRASGGMSGQGNSSARKDAWVPVPHPPGDNMGPQIASVKEFGAWHFACLKQAQAGPKVGYIQNFGITSDQTQAGKPEPCHVFIMMRNSAAPEQTVLVAFRYLFGAPEPQLAVIYTTSDARPMLYDPSGQIHNLNSKEKMHGGFHREMETGPNGKKISVASKNIPNVDISFGSTRVSIPIRICLRQHCIAHIMFTQPAAVGPGTDVALRLPPGLQGEPARELTMPGDGLSTALAELQRTRHP
jgi:hypothetical protein